MANEQLKASVFLVDDHALVREQLAALLGTEADLKVCGTAAGGPAALLEIEQQEPDLVILDVAFPRARNLELLKGLRKSRPRLPVLVLSMHDEPRYATRALQAGATGYISKEEATTNVLAAVRTVLAGQAYLSEQMVQRLRQKASAEEVMLREGEDATMKALVAGGNRTKACQGLVALTLLCAAAIAPSDAVGQTWGDITFLVGSDLHYGYTNSSTSCAALCRATLDRMNSLPGQPYPAAAGGGIVDPPRGVLLVGDLTDSGAAAEWAAFTNDWGLNGDRRLSWPVYEAFGNHDIAANEIVAPEISARNLSRRGVTNVSTNGYHYSWDWDALHLVCLNLFPGPACPDAWRNPRDSLSFLADDLARTVGNTGRPVVLFHHFGMDNFSLDYWTDQQRSNYLAVIRNYNVVAIFAGHNHLVDYVPWCGLSTFNDGTASKPLGPPYLNFLVVHLTQTSLTVVERRSDDTWGNTYSTTHSQPHIISDPVSTTISAGSGATLAVAATGPSLSYQWFFNATNAIVGATNSLISLTNLQLSQSGAYSARVCNSFGAVLSRPATLAVSAPLVINPVPAVMLSSDIGVSLNLEYCDALVPTAVWRHWLAVTLTNANQVVFDSAAPPGGQRFYRVNPPRGGLSLVRVPMITVQGEAGTRLRLEYNDSPDVGTNWLPLTTLTLTAPSQVFVDASAPGMGRRYRALADPPGPVTSPVTSITGTLDFGSVPINTTSNKTLVVKNSGAGTLSGTCSVASPFSITSGATYSLGSNELQDVTVCYNPIDSGSHSQTVTFSDNGGGGSLTATGTAIASLNTNVAVIMFKQAGYTNTLGANRGPVISKAFASANTSGNFIVAAAQADAAGDTITISDTAGNIYTPIGSGIPWGTSDGLLKMFFATNIVSGPNTVIATFSNAGRWEQLSIAEYSGVHRASPLDVIASAAGYGTVSSGSATTTTYGDLLVGVANAWGQLSADTPFTNRVNSGVILQDYTAAMPGDISATWGDTISPDHFGAIMAAFKPQPNSAGTNSLR